MPTYRYLARDWHGRSLSGAYPAASLKEALEQLRSQKLIVMNIKEQSAARESSFGGQWRDIFSRKKARARDFMVFCRQFATMLAAGMTALHSLQVLSQQMEHPAFRELLREVALSLEKGNTLAESFSRQAGFFPTILVSMVEAGEAGGILDTVFERLADHFQKQHDLEEKIRSSTTYPIVISVAAVIVMAIMVLFVLPQFAAIFAGMGVQLPWITRALLGLGGFLIQFWYLIAGLIVLLLAALRRYLRTEQGRFNYDRLRLRLPLFGPIYRKLVVARFARTLSTLLASGVGLLVSLELVAKVIDNRIFSGALEKSREVIRQGQPMAAPLRASGLFPMLLVEMVHVGEETGALDSMLSRSADFYESEVSYVVERLSTIIEPVLLVGIGIFVGLLVISIVTPMFQIYEMI